MRLWLGRRLRVNYLRGLYAISYLYQLQRVRHSTKNYGAVSKRDLTKVKPVMC